MKYKNLKSIIVYLKSCANEIYLDRMAMGLIGLDKEIDFEVIRPIALKKYILKNKIFVKLLLIVSARLWIFLNFLVAFLQLLVSFFLKIRYRKVSIINRRVLVDLTPMLSYRVMSINAIPEIKVTKLTSDRRNNIYNIYNFLSMRDLISSFMFSCYSPGYLRRIESNRAQLLQTYTSYSWFVTWFALNNLQPSEIWFGNHFDRWAILIDHIKSKNTLVQHGIEDGSFSPPIKLNSVKTLYAFNADQVLFFDQKIITSKFSIEYFKPTIVVQKLSLSVPSVLIIGNQSLYFKKEKSFIAGLQHLEVKVFLKPHPRQSTEAYKKLRGEFEFELLTEPYYFPDVNYVISYKSTLALEYELIGKNVFYHTDISTEEIISNINNG